MTVEHELGGSIYTDSTKWLPANWTANKFSLHGQHLGPVCRVAPSICTHRGRVSVQQHKHKSMSSGAPWRTLNGTFT